MMKTVRALENMRKRLPERPTRSGEPVFAQPALIEVPEPEYVPYWRR